MAELVNWTQIDELGDCSFDVLGSNLEISIPAGVGHNLYVAGQLYAPQYVQSCSNDDFDVGCLIVGPLTGDSTSQGIVVKESAERWIRFDVGSYIGGSTLKQRIFSVVYWDGVAGTAKINNADSGATYPLHLRVNRTGDVFTFYTSSDGVNWTNLVSFTQVISVSQVGLAALTGDTNPAFVAQFAEIFVDFSPSKISASLSAVVQNNDTASFSGKLKISGTLDAHEREYFGEFSTVANFVGKVPIKGSLIAKGPNDSAAFSGKLKVKAALSAVGPLDHASFRGSLLPFLTSIPDFQEHAVYTVYAVTRNYTIKYRQVALLPSKAPYEFITLRFDFRRLVKSIDSVDSVVVQLVSGVDPDVASMRVGNHSVDGTSVYQLVKGGVSGAFYIVRANIVRGSEKFSLAAYLPVLELS